MKKTKKTDKKLALSKTTLRRMDLAAVSGGLGLPRTTQMPTITCGGPACSLEGCTNTNFTTTC